MHLFHLFFLLVIYTFQSSPSPTRVIPFIFPSIRQNTSGPNCDRAGISDIPRFYKPQGSRCQEDFCHGLRVFLDNKELHTGDTLSPAILRAIQSASVHIALLTEHYAESPWCLEELCWILRSYHKRKMKIIPVFCDVEPKDLRYVESGRYAKAFEEHQRKGRVAIEDIQKWRTALNEASHISGLLLKTNESDHGEILERIVKAVLKEVKWEPLEVATYPVGFQEAVEDFQSEIMKQTELNCAIIVGIGGIGGVGKSTLAKCFYNLKRADFARSCYLSDVREKDLPSLQHKLLRDLLGYDLHIDNTSQGKGILRDRLGGLVVLIVLDDVDHLEQINCLLVTDGVGSGSLILITSRNQDLLRRCSPKIVLYNVKTLPGKHAHELFCRHAFLQFEPYEGFKDLVEEFLRICGGLPLSLQVLGAQLRQGMPDRRYWELQLEKFSRSLPDDIIKILKVSYETLNNQEKEMFLDIGCFLAGEDKDLVFRVLEGLGYNDAMDCLESLRQRCLVEYHYDDARSDDNDEIEYHKKTSGNDMKYITLGPHGLLLPNGPKGKYKTSTTTLKVTMHDHIKKMAKQIARKEIFMLQGPKPLRLSCSNDIQAMLMWQMSDDQEVRYMMGKFKIKMVDIIFDTLTSGSHMKIENFHSHSAILLCFITPHIPLATAASLHVSFKASNYDGPAHEYTTLRYLCGLISLICLEITNYGHRCILPR